MRVAFLLHQSENHSTCPIALFAFHKQRYILCMNKKKTACFFFFSTLFLYNMPLFINQIS